MIVAFSRLNQKVKEVGSEAFVPVHKDELNYMTIYNRLDEQDFNLLTETQNTFYLKRFCKENYKEFFVLLEKLKEEGGEFNARTDIKHDRKDERDGNASGIY